MFDELTLKHALSVKSVPQLKLLKEQFDNDRAINLNEGKPQIIEQLTPIIPETYYEEIVEAAFYKPNVRYNAFLAKYEGNMPSTEDLKRHCENFNNDSDWPNEEDLIRGSEKQTINLNEDLERENSVLFHYTVYKKRLEFDVDVAQSMPVTRRKIVRIQVNTQSQIISVFTGDTDLFNQILIDLMKIINPNVKPLTVQKTGISNMTVGSFSFHTVKVLDYLYHGLSKIGTVGIIKHIELDTPSSSKKPQKVKVNGENLLIDESICKYLFLRGRDLSGIKIEFSFKIDGEHFKTNIEIGIRDNRMKISLTKEKYKESQITVFFNILQENIKKYLGRPGLINEKETINILDQLKKIALQ